MPTADLYPVSTITGQWAPTPPTTDHHTLVDETSPDTSDFVRVTGFSGGLVEEFGLPNLPVGADRLTSLQVRVHLKGLVDVNSPAIQAQVLLNGAVLLTHSGNCTSGGVFVDFLTIMVTTNIPANVWNAGDKRLRFLPLNGDSQYPQFEQV